MPFQSEKQRRYLWANEPEIARDWTDTYGSRIEAALGGIMKSRVGLKFGMSPGEAGARGLGAEAHGGPTGGQEGNGVQGVPDFVTSTGPRTGPKSFGDKVGGFFKNFNLLDYAPIIGKKSLTGWGLRQLGPLATDIFGDKPPPGHPEYNTTATLGPTGTPDRRDRPYLPPQYIDDLYAQNILGDEELDIDTSTGNMEDWSQRFRVDDQYRQDKQGQLDPQIVEMINNLYT